MALGELLAREVIRALAALLAAGAGTPAATATGLAAKLQAGLPGDGGHWICADIIIGASPVNGSLARARTGRGSRAAGAVTPRARRPLSDLARAHSAHSPGYGWQKKEKSRRRCTRAGGKVPETRATCGYVDARMGAPLI